MRTDQEEKRPSLKKMEPKWLLSGTFWKNGFNFLEKWFHFFTIPDLQVSFGVECNLTKSVPDPLFYKNG